MENAAAAGCFGKSLSIFVLFYTSMLTFLEEEQIVAKLFPM